MYDYDESYWEKRPKNDAVDIRQVSEAVEEYANSASMHGIGHFSRAGVPIQNRIFWITVFLCCVTALGYQISALISRYHEFEKQTNIEMKFDIHPFPAVTVCSLNPYKNQETPRAKELMELLYATKVAKGKLINEIMLRVGAKKYGFEGAKDSMAIQARAQENLPYIVRTLNSTIVDKLVFNQSDIIRSCAYNTKSCKDDDFAYLPDPKYGSCFMFNFDKPAKYFSSRAGPLYGLRLILFSNKSEYIETTDSAGARIVIHDQLKFPFPDTYGYNTGSGSAISLSLRGSVNKRIVYGESKCTDSIFEIEYYFQGEYTMEGCQRSCYQRRVVDQCGCGDPKYPLPPDRVSVYCLFNDTQARMCILNFDKNIAPSMQCPCPIPCTETSFAVTISSSQWLTDSGKTFAACEQPMSVECKEAMSNAMLIEIFYEHLNKQVIWETAAYSVIYYYFVSYTWYQVYNLISDCAGQVGFWIGLSFLGTVEFFVFLFTIIAYAASQIRGHILKRVSPSIPLVDSPDLLSRAPTPVATPAPRKQDPIRINRPCRPKCVAAPSSESSTTRTTVSTIITTTTGATMSTDSTARRNGNIWRP